MALIWTSAPCRKVLADGKRRGPGGGAGRSIDMIDERGLVVVLPGREIIGEELAAVLEQTPLV